MLREDEDDPREEDGVWVWPLGWILTLGSGPGRPNSAM